MKFATRFDAMETNKRSSPISLYVLDVLCGIVSWISVRNRDGASVNVLVRGYTHNRLQTIIDKQGRNHSISRSDVQRIALRRFSFFVLFLYKKEKEKVPVYLNKETVQCSRRGLPLKLVIEHPCSRRRPGCWQ